jgi:hypothetical protein
MDREKNASVRHHGCIGKTSQSPPRRLPAGWQFCRTISPYSPTKCLCQDGGYLMPHHYCDIILPSTIPSTAAPESTPHILKPLRPVPHLPAFLQKVHRSLVQQNRTTKRNCIRPSFAWPCKGCLGHTLAGYWRPVHRGISVAPLLPSRSFQENRQASGPSRIIGRPVLRLVGTDQSSCLVTSSS